MALADSPLWTEADATQNGPHHLNGPSYPLNNWFVQLGDPEGWISGISTLC